MFVDSSRVDGAVFQGHRWPESVLDRLCGMLC